jgi:hypothetical protein
LDIFKLSTPLRTKLATQPRILNQCANAAVRRKGSIFEILYRRLVPRLGPSPSKSPTPELLVGFEDLK